MGSAGQSDPLSFSLSFSLSLSFSFPWDLLITLESECSLAFACSREKQQNIACSSAAQPPGTSQRRRPYVIYTPRLFPLTIFPRQSLLSWEINRLFLFSSFPLSPSLSFSLSRSFFSFSVFAFAAQVATRQHYIASDVTERASQWPPPLFPAIVDSSPVKLAVPGLANRIPGVCQQ